MLGRSIGRRLLCSDGGSGKKSASEITKLVEKSKADRALMTKLKKFNRRFQPPPLHIQPLKRRVMYHFDKQTSIHRLTGTGTLGALAAEGKRAEFRAKRKEMLEKIMPMAKKRDVISKIQKARRGGLQKLTGRKDPGIRFMKQWKEDESPEIRAAALDLVHKLENDKPIIRTIASVIQYKDVWKGLGPERGSGGRDDMVKGMNMTNANVLTMKRYLGSENAGASEWLSTVHSQMFHVFKRNNGDTGTYESQIASCTIGINKLKVELDTKPDSEDIHRRIRIMLQNRRDLLEYLRANHYQRYKDCICMLFSRGAVQGF